VVTSITLLSAALNICFTFEWQYMITYDIIRLSFRYPIEELIHSLTVLFAFYFLTSYLPWILWKSYQCVCKTKTTLCLSVWPLLISRSQYVMRMLHFPYYTFNASQSALRMNWKCMSCSSLVVSRVFWWGERLVGSSLAFKVESYLSRGNTTRQARIRRMEVANGPPCG